MAVTSRYIQVHPDALIEWIWDDQFFFEDEYSIITDTKNNSVNFTFSEIINEPNNYNKIPNQLYKIDEVINKYGIANPATKSFLQEVRYVNNSPSKFNKVKIWFPLSYNFNTSTGFYLRTYALNYENAVKYELSNYFLDITVPGELTKIQTDNKPFRLNEKLWGKSITIYVPEVYTEALNRTNGSPTVGTINYTLTNGVLGLSQTSPIFIDFRFLSKKITVLNETTYITTPPLITSLPQTPEYNSLGVKIEPATDGDYFKINAIYNNSVTEFDSFMLMLEQSGKRSYILYSITVYEENIPQETREIYVYEDFTKGITDYRPVFMFSSTTASIRVDLKLINLVDSNVVTKSAEYTMIGNEVSKYGKYITPINISNAIKPKLYNSKTDQLVLPSKELINSHIKKSGNSEIKYVPYPVLINSYSIVANDLNNVTINGTTFLGQGQLNLVLTPFDNIIKLAMGEKDNNNFIKPFSLPATNTIINIVFKSIIGEIRIPLFLESNEIDLNLGILVFRITTTDLDKIKKIRETNTVFYLTMITNNIESVIYNGTFTIVI